MLGKQKCRILKEIRQRIADENDIPYVTRECSYRGECSGTCPRCESELRYLEKQLALRASLGKKVAVAALCAGMSFAVSACAPFGGRDVEPLEGETVELTPEPLGSKTEYASPEPNSKTFSENPGQETGDDGEDDGRIELSGDVAYVPPQSPAAAVGIGRFGPEENGGGDG